MLKFISRIPWWGWAGIILAIVIGWQMATGAALTRSLYNQVLDGLRADQSKVVKNLEANEKMYEDRIKQLDAQIAQIQKDKVALAQDAAKSKAEIARLTGVIDDLQNQIDNLIVSTDPDSIIRELQRRFPSIRRTK